MKEYIWENATVNLYYLGVAWGFYSIFHIIFNATIPTLESEWAFQLLWIRTNKSIHSHADKLIPFHPLFISRSHCSYFLFDFICNLSMFLICVLFSPLLHSRKRKFSPSLDTGHSVAEIVSSVNLRINLFLHVQYELDRKRKTGLFINVEKSFVHQKMLTNFEIQWNHIL